MKPLLLALLAAAATGHGAAAQDQVQDRVSPVVVELYTSQGCSSCPPADALLADLAERPDVLALALHVDYWDYIGWADTFASPSFTQRQKLYALAAGHRSIYTPQMVIAGVDNVIGFRPMEVAELIDLHRAAPPLAQVILHRDGDKLAISLLPGKPVAMAEVARGNGTVAMTSVAPDGQGLRKAGPDGLVVQLVRYTATETVDIERGENEGRRIDYVNVVTAWSALGEWDGVSPMDLTSDVPGPDAVAVIVQRAGMGPVVAAATLP